MNNILKTVLFFSIFLIIFSFTVLSDGARVNTNAGATEVNSPNICRMITNTGNHDIFIGKTDAEFNSFLDNMCSKNFISCNDCCVSKHEKKCYNNKVYWYDSCGVRENLVESCYSDYYTYGNKYCKDDSTEARLKKYYDAGCSGGSCYTSYSHSSTQYTACTGSEIEYRDLWYAGYCTGGGCVCPLTYETYSQFFPFLCDYPTDYPLCNLIEDQCCEENTQLICCDAPSYLALMLSTMVSPGSIDALIYKCNDNPSYRCGDDCDCQSLSSDTVGYCDNGRCEHLSCEDAGVTCGTYEVGCETVNCGSCPAGTSCVGGECCFTTSSCSHYGITCGSYDNGCGGRINCGSCPAGTSCVGGECCFTT